MYIITFLTSGLSFSLAGPPVSTISSHPGSIKKPNNTQSADRHKCSGCHRFTYMMCVCFTVMVWELRLSSSELLLSVVLTHVHTIGTSNTHKITCRAECSGLDSLSLLIINVSYCRLSHFFF